MSACGECAGQVQQEASAASVVQQAEALQQHLATLDTTPAEVRPDPGRVHAAA